MRSGGLSSVRENEPWVVVAQRSILHGINNFGALVESRDKGIGCVSNRKDKYYRDYGGKWADSLVRYLE